MTMMLKATVAIRILQYHVGYADLLYYLLLIRKCNGQQQLSSQHHACRHHVAYPRLHHKACWHIQEQAATNGQSGDGLELDHQHIPCVALCIGVIAPYPNAVRRTLLFPDIALLEREWNLRFKWSWGAVALPWEHC